MYFTSRLRSAVVSLQRESGARDVITAAQGTFNAFTAGLLRTEAENFFGGSFMPVIAMAVNPSSVTFNQPKRWTKKDTRQCSVYFHFTNTRGQNNDVLTMGFKGNTGNIDLRGTVGNPDLSIDQNTQGFDTGALQKYLCFHNLYALTREPMLLDDGTQNVFTIGYQSGVFPEMIFDGFFSKVLEFEENGEKPNSRDYYFEFIVRNTYPLLDQVLGQISALAGSPGGPVLVGPPAGTFVLWGGQGDTAPAATTELPSGVGAFSPNATLA